MPRSCAALDNVSIPQVAVQKKMIATIFRIFPSLVSSLSSLLSIELVTKEGKKGRERKKKKKRVSIGKRGRNLFVSGRKNGRPVEAKPADCLVSGTCVCADQRGSRVDERGQRGQKCDGQPNYRDACRQVSGISFFPVSLPLFIPSSIVIPLYSSFYAFFQTRLLFVHHPHFLFFFFYEFRSFPIDPSTIFRNREQRRFLFGTKA